MCEHGIGIDGRGLPFVDAGGGCGIHIGASSKDKSFSKCVDQWMYGIPGYESSQTFTGTISGDLLGGSVEGSTKITYSPQTGLTSLCVAASNSQLFACIDAIEGCDEVCQ